MPRQATALSRVLVTLSTIVVGLVLLLPSAGKASDGEVDHVSYRVQPGDTVWEIAVEHVGNGGDVRETVGTILRLNDLESSLIMPGQVLEIPAPSS